MKDGGKGNGHASHVSILETTGHGADKFLGDDGVVEVVELLTLNGTIKEGDTVQVLAWTYTHVQDSGLGHLVDKVLGDVLALHLGLLCFWSDVLIDELPHRLLKTTMGIIVVWAAELWLQPRRLSVWNRRKLSDLWHENLGLLALDCADAKVVIFLEDLLAMEVVEGFGAVLACYLLEDEGSSWVSVDKVGDIVDFVVDDEPGGVVGGVFGDFVAGEHLVRHGRM